jgi:hypothetical protein
MVLEAVTNLPEETIERLARHASDEGRVRTDELRALAAEHALAADLDAAIGQAATSAADAHPSSAAAARSAAQVAAESFPLSAAEVIRAASATGTRSPVHASVRVHRPHRAKRPGP